MKSSKPKKSKATKQLPSPIVLATAWVIKDGTPKQPFTTRRSTAGTTVELASDGVSALIRFSAPETTGFVPVVTSVLKGRSAQDVYVSHMGSKYDHSVRVSARGVMGGKPVSPLSFTIVIVGM